MNTRALLLISSLLSTLSGPLVTDGAAAVSTMQGPVDLAALGARAHVAVGDTIYFVGNLTRHRVGAEPDNLYAIALGGGLPRAVLDPAEAQSLFTRHVGDLIYIPQSDSLILTSGRTLQPEERGMPSRLVSIEIAEGSHEVLVENGRYNSMLAVSPDGTRVAYCSAPADIDAQQWEGLPEGGYAIRVYDLRMGEDVEIAPPNQRPHPHGPPAWSPAGDRIAFVAMYPEEGQDRSRIWLVDPDGANREMVDFGLDYAADAVVWPTGDTLVFSTAERGEMPSRGLYQLDLRRLRATLMAEGMILGESLSLSPDRQHLAFMRAGPDRRFAQQLMTSEGLPVTQRAYDLLMEGRWRVQPAPGSAEAR